MNGEQEKINAQIRALDDLDRIEFERRYKKVERSEDLMAILCFFLFGVHRIYLGQLGYGLLLFFLNWGMLLLVLNTRSEFAFILWGLTILFLSIHFIHDLLLHKKITQRANFLRKQQILAEMLAESTTTKTVF